MHTKKKISLRIIATLLVVAFTASELSAAPITISPPAKASERLLSDPTLLEVPAAYSYLNEIHPGTNGKFIIHIQDAHSNFSGQDSLANTLDSLMKKYEISLVLSEGGYGDCTLTPIKSIAKPEVWKRVARSFLMSGKLQGEEYLNLVSDNPMKIIGIEDAHLYDKSVDAYRTLAEKRASILARLDKLDRAIGKLKNKLYPSDLKAYDKLRADKSAGFEKSFDVFLELSKKAGLDMGAFTELSQLALIRDEERLINFDLANLEQAVMAEEVHQKGGKDDLEEALKKMEEVKGNKIALFTHFQNTLNIAQEKGVDVQKFRNLQQYVEYLRKFSEIDFDRLLPEYERAEDELYQKVILANDSLNNEDALLLRSVDRFIELVITAHEIKMTADQFALLKFNEPDFRTESMEAFLNRKLAENGYFEDMIAAEPILEEGRAALDAFYASVTERDLAFMRNVENILEREDQKIAFLITGGYHTRHLKKLLREKGYGYSVLAPMVSAETNQKKYEALLLADKAAPKKRVHLVEGQAGKNGLLAEADDDLAKLMRKKKDGVRAPLLAIAENGARLTELTVAAGSTLGVEKIKGMLSKTPAGSRLAEKEPNFWYDKKDIEVLGKILDLYDDYRDSISPTNTSVTGPDGYARAKRREFEEKSKKLLLRTWNKWSEELSDTQDLPDMHSEWIETYIGRFGRGIPPDVIKGALSDVLSGWMNEHGVKPKDSLGTMLGFDVQRVIKGGKYVSLSLIGGAMATFLWDVTFSEFPDRYSLPAFIFALLLYTGFTLGVPTMILAGLNDLVDESPRIRKMIKRITRFFKKEQEMPVEKTQIKNTYLFDPKGTTKELPAPAPIRTAQEEMNDAVNAREPVKVEIKKDGARLSGNGWPKWVLALSVASAALFTSGSGQKTVSQTAQTPSRIQKLMESDDAREKQEILIDQLVKQLSDRDAGIRNKAKFELRKVLEKALSRTSDVSGVPAYLEKAVNQLNDRSAALSVVEIAIQMDRYAEADRLLEKHTAPAEFSVLKRFLHQRNGSSASQIVRQNALEAQESIRRYLEGKNEVSLTDQVLSSEQRSLYLMDGYLSVLIFLTSSNPGLFEKKFDEISKTILSTLTVYGDDRSFKGGKQFEVGLEGLRRAGKVLKSKDLNLLGIKAHEIGHSWMVRDGVLPLSSEWEADSVFHYFLQLINSMSLENIEKVTDKTVRDYYAKEPDYCAHCITLVEDIKKEPLVDSRLSDIHDQSRIYIIKLLHAAKQNGHEIDWGLMLESIQRVQARVKRQPELGTYDLIVLEEYLSQVTQTKNKQLIKESNVYRNPDIPRIKNINDLFGKYGFKKQGARLADGGALRSETLARQKSDPGAWIVYGDMMKLGLLSRLYGAGAGDVFVAEALEKAQKVIQKYGGILYRKGAKSDEMMGILPAVTPNGEMMTAEKADGVLREAFSGIVEFYETYRGYARISVQLTREEIARLRLHKDILSLESRPVVDAKGNLADAFMIIFAREPGESHDKAMTRILAEANVARRAETMRLLPPFLAMGSVPNDPSMDFEDLLTRAKEIQGLAKARAGSQTLKNTPVGAEGHNGLVRRAKVRKKESPKLIGNDIHDEILRQQEELKELDARGAYTVEPLYGSFSLNDLSVILSEASQDRGGTAKTWVVRKAPESFYFVSSDGRGRWQAALVQAAYVAEKEMIKIMFNFFRAKSQRGRPEGESGQFFGFKQINDSIGEDFGDDLIRLVNVSLFRALKGAYAKDGILSEEAFFESLTRAKDSINLLTAAQGFSSQFTATVVESEDFRSPPSSEEILEALQAVSEARGAAVNAERSRAENPRVRLRLYKDFQKPEIMRQIMADLKKAEAEQRRRAWQDLKNTYSPARTPVSGARLAHDGAHPVTIGRMARAADVAGYRPLSEVRKISEEFGLLTDYPVTGLDEPGAVDEVLKKVQRDIKEYRLDPKYTALLERSYNALLPEKERHRALIRVFWEFRKDIPMIRKARDDIPQDELDRIQAALFQTAVKMVIDSAQESILTLLSYQNTEEKMPVLERLKMLPKWAHENQKNTAANAVLLALFASDPDLEASLKVQFKEFSVDQPGYFEALRNLYAAGFFHDIGKTLGQIINPREGKPSILESPDKLSDEEFRIMRRHVPEGVRIMQKEIPDFVYQRAGLDKLAIKFGILGHHRGLPATKSLERRSAMVGYPNLSIADLSRIALLLRLADSLDAALDARRLYSLKDPNGLTISPKRIEDVMPTFDESYHPYAVQVIRRITESTDIFRPVYPSSRPDLVAIPKRLPASEDQRKILNVYGLEESNLMDIDLNELKKRYLSGALSSDAEGRAWLLSRFRSAEKDGSIAIRGLDSVLKREAFTDGFAHYRTVALAVEDWILETVGASKGDYFDMGYAVSEALRNAQIWGNRDSGKVIVIHAEKSPSGLYVDIADQGLLFTVSKNPERSVPAPDFIDGRFYGMGSMPAGGGFKNGIEPYLVRIPSGNPVLGGHLWSDEGEMLSAGKVVQMFFQTPALGARLADNAIVWQASFTSSELKELLPKKKLKDVLFDEVMEKSGKFGFIDEAVERILAESAVLEKREAVQFYYEAWLKTMLYPIIENAFDAYLKSSESELMPLTLNISILKEKGQSVLRVVSHGIPFGAGTPQTEEKKLDSGQFGGKGLGLAYVENLVYILPEASIEMRDRMTAMGDEDGAVFDFRFNPSKIDDSFTRKLHGIFVSGVPFAGARLSAETIERPLAALGADEVRSVLIRQKYENLTLRGKLGHEVIEIAALVMALLRKFPDAVITVETEYPDIFKAQAWAGRVNPVSASEAGTASAELIIDISDNPWKEEGVLGEKEGVRWIGVPSSVRVYDIVLREEEDSFSTLYKDGASQIYRVEEQIGDLSGGRDAGEIWKFSLNLVESLGLDANALTVPFAAEESDRAQEMVRGWHRESKEGWLREAFSKNLLPDDLGERDFSEKAKIVVFNVLGATQNEILEYDEWADAVIQILSGLDDAYLVVQYPPVKGGDESDLKFIRRILDHVARRVIAEPELEPLYSKLDRLILPASGQPLSETHLLMGLARETGGGVFTLDTGLAHLAALYDLPLSVIIRKDFEDWLPVGADGIVPPVEWFEPDPQNTRGEAFREGAARFIEKLSKVQVSQAIPGPLYEVALETAAKYDANVEGQCIDATRYAFAALTAKGIVSQRRDFHVSYDWAKESEAGDPTINHTVLEVTMNGAEWVIDTQLLQFAQIRDNRQFLDGELISRYVYPADEYYSKIPAYQDSVSIERILSSANAGSRLAGIKVSPEVAELFKTAETLDDRSLQRDLVSLSNFGYSILKVSIYERIFAEIPFSERATQNQAYSKIENQIGSQYLKLVRQKERSAMKFSNKVKNYSRKFRESAPVAAALGILALDDHAKAQKVAELIVSDTLENDPSIILRSNDDVWGFNGSHPSELYQKNRQALDEVQERLGVSALSDKAKSLLALIFSNERAVRSNHKQEQTAIRLATLGDAVLNAWAEKQVANAYLKARSRVVHTMPYNVITNYLVGRKALSSILAKSGLLELFTRESGVDKIESHYQADIYEAVLAALYLSYDTEKRWEVVDRFLKQSFVATFLDGTKADDFDLDRVLEAVNEESPKGARLAESEISREVEFAIGEIDGWLPYKFEKDKLEEEIMYKSGKFDEAIAEIADKLLSDRPAADASRTDEESYKYYMAWLKALFFPAIENAFDAYLEQLEKSPDVPEPLTLTLGYSKSSQNSGTAVLKLTSNGATPIEGTRNTEEKRNDPRRFGGVGGGLTHVSILTAGVTPRDEGFPYTIKGREDRSGAVFEVYVDLKRLNSNFIEDHLRPMFGQPDGGYPISPPGARLASEEFSESDTASANADNQTKLLLAQLYLSRSKSILGKKFNFLFDALKRRAAIEFMEVNGKISAQLYSVPTGIPGSFEAVGGPIDLTDSLAEARSMKTLSSAETKSIADEVYALAEPATRSGSIARLVMKLLTKTEIHTAVMIVLAVDPAEIEYVRETKDRFEKQYNAERRVAYFKFVDKNGDDIIELTDSADIPDNIVEVRMSSASASFLESAQSDNARVFTVEAADYRDREIGVLPLFAAFGMALFVANVDSIKPENDLAIQALSRLTGGPFAVEKYDLYVNPDPKKTPDYEEISVKRIARIAIDKILQFTRLALQAIGSAA